MAETSESNLPRVQWGAILQTHFTYQEGMFLTQSGYQGDPAYGIAIKRFRVWGAGTVTERIYLKFQIAYDRLATPYLLDAFADYLLMDNLKIRLGKFVSVGPKGGSLTPSFALDFCERSAALIYWQNKTALHTWRDLGVMLDGKIDQNIRYKFQVTNGNGQKFVFANFGSGVINPGAKGVSVGAALEGQLRHFQTGCFAVRSNPYASNFEGVSFGAHFYYLLQNLTIKAEFVAWDGDYVNTPLLEEQSQRTPDTAFGYLLAALYYVFPSVQVGVRYDRFDYDFYTDGYYEEDITFAVNYHFIPYNNRKAKIQLNYVLQKENIPDEPNNNLLVINFQVVL
jgi:hypothetical protein